MTNRQVSVFNLVLNDPEADHALSVGPRRIPGATSHTIIKDCSFISVPGTDLVVVNTEAIVGIQTEFEDRSITTPLRGAPQQYHPNLKQVILAIGFDNPWGSRNFLSSIFYSMGKHIT